MLAFPTAEERPVVEAVLLDLDDTLIDTRGAFRVAVQHVISTWIPQLDDARHEDAVRHWALDPGGHFRAFTRGELTFAEQRRARAVDLHAEFGGPLLDDERLAEWDTGYEQAFRAAWRPLPDGIALMAVLRHLGVPFGALTNMSAGYQRDKLALVGMGDVPVLVSIDDLGRGKPDPEVFRLGCRRLGVAPHRVAYVGDELDIDARGARDAGLVGVWVDRHATGATPDDVLVVRTLTELPDVLDLG
ncbi:MAG TPA: HAD family hydrolase [Kineosporiaceae bacterium]|jgi:putative hydrolase of the HAD superfamily|nr:HAD family hydrolase [Kineosporiaceae bacterium]